MLDYSDFFQMLSDILFTLQEIILFQFLIQLRKLHFDKLHQTKYISFCNVNSTYLLKQQP